MRDYIIRTLVHGVPLTLMTTIQLTVDKDIFDAITLTDTHASLPLPVAEQLLAKPTRPVWRPIPESLPTENSMYAIMLEGARRLGVSSELLSLELLSLENVELIATAINKTPDGKELMFSIYHKGFVDYKNYDPITDLFVAAGIL